MPARGTVPRLTKKGPSMKKMLLVALSSAALSFTAGPAPALALPGHVVVARHHHHHHHGAAHHSCTRTSSGSCIRGGDFCPQASYGDNGWDAQGRRYVCKGDHTHPHWMLP